MPLHSSSLALQVRTHAPPAQVAVALEGGAHGEQEDPQELTLASLTQAPPHR